MRTAIFLMSSFCASLTFGADTAPDEVFFKKAAEVELAQVELGTLAEAKGQSQSVKEFGAMMIKDHSAANEKLKALAGSKAIDLPTSPSVGQIITKAKLEVTSGEAFDKYYIKGMMSDHREEIQTFEDEARNGRDADARAFAAEGLPDLRIYFKRIQEMAAAAGVSAD